MLKYKFFRASTENPEPIEQAMNTFLSTHRVVHVEKQFHSDGAGGFWSFCISWEDGESEGPKTRSRTPAKIDYREVLTAPQFDVFAKLRDCRKMLAERDGVPLYNVATNEQLAMMVQKKLTSKTGLAKTAKLGEARIAKYADSLLQVLAEAFDTESAKDDDETASQAEAT